MTRNRKVSVALALLAVLALPLTSYVLPALAAGLWPNFPIVGSAAFCSSTNQAGVPGTSSVCTTTTPIGPTIVTGLETIPADTHKASGGSPQTVNLTLASLNALPLTSTTVTGSQASSVGFAPTVLDGGLIIINGSGSITAATVTLPPSAIDGQQFRLTANQSISTLTVSGAGSDTVSNAPTALTVSTTGGPYGYTFRYRKSDTKWYRLQ